MDNTLAYTFLGQLIFCGISQIFITLPIVYILFKYYIDKSYSLVLRLYFIYLGIFGLASIFNSIYLISIWSLDPSTTYNLRTLCLTGFLPWSLQFAMYQFEFFLTLERCLAIYLKHNYTYNLKTFLGCLTILSSIIFQVTFFIADEYPIWAPNIPTKCKFYGCVIDQGSTVTMMAMTYANSAINLIFIGILMVIVFYYVKSPSGHEKLLYKTTIINVIILTIIQWIPHFLSALSYAVLQNKLTAIIGPIRYTRSCLALSISSLIYYRMFSQRAKGRVMQTRSATNASSVVTTTPTRVS